MEEEKEKETKIRTIEEIEVKLAELRNNYKDSSPSPYSNDYKESIRNQYYILQWVLRKKYCLMCGKTHERMSYVCSGECSIALYGCV